MINRRGHGGRRFDRLGGNCRFGRAHHHVDVRLVETVARQRGAVEERRFAAVRAFAFGGLGRHGAVEAPDADHRVDPALEVVHHLDHLAGALAGQILERAGGIDVGRLAIDEVADRGVQALLAHRPGDLLDLLGGGQDVGGRGLGRLDDRIELLGRLPELAVMRGVGLDRGDFRLGAGDRLGHLDQVEADAVDRLDAALAPQHRLEAVEGGKQHRGVGVAVAPGILGQEPAPAHGLHDRGFDGLVIGLAERGRGGRHAEGPA